LVRLIAQNWHQIVFDKKLLDRYYGHLNKLVNVNSPILTVAFFFNQLIKVKQKIDNLFVSPPPLNEESNFPTKHIHVVRVAHHFQAITVTTDGPLRDAINVKRIPNLQALSPPEAITCAQQT
jgi:hypothetical protein